MNDPKWPQQPELFTYCEQEDQMSAIALSRNCKYAAQTGPKFLLIFRVEDRKQLKHIQTSGIINFIEFSPNSELLVGTKEQELFIWSLLNLKTQPIILNQSALFIGRLLFSADSSILVTVNSDKSVRLWDIKQQQAIKTFEGHESLVFGSAMDGNLLATIGSDNNINVWNHQTEKRIKQFRCSKQAGGAGFCVQFSKNHSILVSSGMDKKIRVWSMQRFKQLRIIKGHQDTILQISFFKNQKSILTTSWDNTFKIWNIRNGHLLYQFDNNFRRSISGCSLAITDDGKVIAALRTPSYFAIWKKNDCKY